VKLVRSRNKKKEYLKAKINELETNNKIKNSRDLYRGISDFKASYQPRTNVVKDEKCDLVTDSHSILGRWRDHFSQQFNAPGVNDVRQKEIHTAEPLVLRSVPLKLRW
jgi:hypothetical protein